MAIETRKPRRRWPWMVSAAVLLLIGAAGAWWFVQGRVWTDGGNLRVPMFGGDKVREILWSEPISPGPQFDIADQVYEPALSPDGQEFYFVRGMPEAPDQDKAIGPRAHSHIYVSYRKDNAWTKPVRLVGIDPVAGQCDDLSPRLSSDGRVLYFSSNRPGGQGGYDIWAAARDSESAWGWGKPFNLGPSINTQYNEYDPDPTPDGKHLIFTTNRTAGAAAQNDVWHATIRQSDAADYDLWIADIDQGSMSRRAAAQPADSAPATQPTTPPHPLESLNTPSVEGASCMSPAGDFIYFTSNRPGGFGKFDLYRARVIDGVFGQPENLGPSINSADNDTDPAIAADGYRIYFSSDRASAAQPSAGPGRYHLLSADSREVFPEEQTHAVPHFGWSVWGVLGCGLAAVLLVLLLRGSNNRKLNLLQKCLVVSILVHVLFTFSLSFVALTQQVTHYVQHEMGAPVAFAMPKELAEKLAVRSQTDTLPLPTPPPKNLPLTAQVKIQSEPLPPPPNVQVSVPDAHLRPGAVQIAVTPPHPPALTPAQAPAPTLAPAVPPVAPAPLAEVQAPPMPAPLHTADARIAPAPAPQIAAAQRQQLPPADAHSAAPIDLGEPAASKLAPPPIAAGPALPDHQAALPPPVAPAPGTPAPPPALPAPQVDVNPTVARVAPQQSESVDDLAASADALAAHQQPRGDADQRTAHSAGPADIPFDARPIKKSVVSNSPGTIAMVVHRAGRPDQPGSAALPGVAATQPAQIADAPQADVPSGLNTANNRPAPTTEPAIADTAVPPDLAHVGPTAVAAPAALPAPAVGPLISAPPTPQSPHSAAGGIVADPALGWRHGDHNTMGAGQPAPAPSAAPAVAQAPAIADIAVGPTAGVAPAPAADPKAIADSGPINVASARLSADSPPSPPGSGAAAMPDLGNITPPPGPRNDPDPAQAGAQGQGAVAMAPMAHAPGIAAPAIMPQVSLEPLTGLSGPASPFARSAPQRQVLLKQNGGTRQSEDAVDRGLAYLASAQEPDGRWTRVMDDSPPGNRPVQMHDMACTGLALLAFLAHDQTPDKPCQYRDAVAKAAGYLLGQEGPDGDLRGPAPLRGGGADHANMYDHGIASFALGELAAMTHDPRYVQAALKAANFTVSAQDPATGGWRYMPGEQGDSSVFGWQIMSLHTAELSGFVMPQATRDGAERFIKLVSQGQFGMLASYQNNRGPTPPMTAEVLFSRMLLHHTVTEPDEIEAIGLLAQQRPSAGNPDLYYWYYASLCMLQMHTPAWKDWNTQTRDTLIAMQQKSGYWDTSIRWGDRGGRVFTTAIATLTLEVYYRYLPLSPTTQPK